ncbi:hypothetical protein ACS2QL_06190 [Bacillus cereus group sp. Bce038]|uniref:hypothetical protein n=1 Tax=Bacillus cereus group sp. Bce038 TaxID=3445231 RepID=UPI003F2327BF
MKIDSFIQLIADIRQNQLSDDTDPANIVLETYTSPFDEVSVVGESVRVLVSQNQVWGNGETYTAKDHSNVPYQAPSCGWLWGASAKWG